MASDDPVVNRSASDSRMTFLGSGRCCLIVPLITNEFEDLIELTRRHLTG